LNVAHSSIFLAVSKSRIVLSLVHFGHASKMARIFAIEKRRGEILSAAVFEGYDTTSPE
jgi:hypothetical protein